ncbi:unnamed protein product [Tetraodon nigroviridis]|uniref:Platelet-derived growth factor receptor-like protein n=1 Tax=Tetraodon nigroviridis TaxID=99883 RepID=Q4RP84_TETNG|nr:unnamed protein product [Tetraodon nigroviridis]
MVSPGCLQLFLVIFCASSLANGHLNKNHRPKILPSEDPLTISKEDSLNLTCRGHGQLHWTLANPNRSLSSSGVKVEKCDSRPHSRTFCSRLTITQLSVRDTGTYSCNSSRNGSANVSSTYVFVKDPEHPFVEQHYPNPDVLFIYGHEQTFVIPCRTSSPDVRVNFTTCQEMQHTNIVRKQQDPPLSDNVVAEWDPKVGFTLPRGDYTSKNYLICKAVDSGQTSNYIPRKLKHPFLNITYRNEHLSTVTVKEGRKKVVFEPKVNALPPAVVLGWFKDDVPIWKNSTCFRMSGLSLSITNVQQKYAGVFKISMGIPEKGVYRNLSYTLVVTSRTWGRRVASCVSCIPEEKPHVVSVEGRKKGSHNWIKSTTTKNEVVNGKIMSVSTLVIEEARASGWYTCVARNEVGDSEMKKPFFIKDHPEGITTQPSSAIEGDDITLTCQAARYFYTTLQWLDSFNRTVTTNLSSLQLGEHSISQSLRLHGVSPNTTRGYRCQARRFNNKVELKNAALIVDGRLC